MSERVRRTRSNGELSRAKILDAATRIASERGYEGTSINLVSKACGLPASSIYWQFNDKDGLIAAVIERSFDQWLAAWDPPLEGSLSDRVSTLARQVASALVESPDFLRLGLMLALERRPVEPTARAMYLRARSSARELLRGSLAEFMPALDRTAVDQLAVYALAGADGLFIAREIDGDVVDFSALFDMHGRSVIDAILRLEARQVDADDTVTAEDAS